MVKLLATLFSFPLAAAIAAAAYARWRDYPLEITLFCSLALFAAALAAATALLKFKREAQISKIYPRELLREWLAGLHWPIVISALIVTNLTTGWLTYSYVRGRYLHMSYELNNLRRAIAEIRTSEIKAAQVKKELPTGSELIAVPATPQPQPPR